MQANAGFVQDIKRAHQGTSKWGSEVDALTLAATQCVGLAVEREIAQSHVNEKLQSVVDFGEQSFANLCVMVVQGKLFEPRMEVGDGHFYQVSDAHAVDFHPTGLSFQACAMTGWTSGPAAIATHHDTVLNLVLILFHHLEKGINAHSVTLVFVHVGW